MTAQSGNDVTRDLSRLQEKLWVLQAQRGDAEAFRSLMTRYERQLLYYLGRFTTRPEEAVDAAQEVWVTVFRGLANLRAPEAFRVWLYQIAHDRVVSHIRREARQEQVIEALTAGQVAGDWQEPPDWGNAERVHQALGLLSPEHCEVLTLRFLEDMSLEEIAETLRCQLGTVKSRLHYARRAMKKVLEEQCRE